MDMKTTTMSLLALTAGVFLCAGDALGQNVGINSDGSTPGLTLDVKPTGTSDGIRINNANGGAGDPIVNFQIDGTSEFTMGVDDSNGDRFKIDNGGALGTAPIISVEAGGDVGINTNNPNNVLDVTGDAQISTYLLVGNPAAPTSIAATKTNLWSTSLNEMDGGLTMENPCGVSFWVFTFTDNTAKNYMLFDNAGASSVSYVYTPYIWVPTGAGDVQFMISHESELETGYDGVYAEVNDNGVWTKLTTGPGPGGPGGNYIFGTDYLTTFTTDGSNPTCTGINGEYMWSGTGGSADPFGLSIFTYSGLAGSWTRFRLVGEEDGSNASGAGFQLYHISVDATLPSFGGAFATGNIYAESNVYAGSNVLLGDLAEYFPLVGTAQPGDVISMIDGSGERYMKSATAYDSKAIGVYSSNPTLTLNDPSSGVPVGLQGRVPVNVTNESGSIKKGDYLTSAFTNGYAMKADKSCYIIGRALEDFDEDKGQILVLLENGWYNPVSTGTSVGPTATKSGVYTVPPLTKSIKVVDPAVQKGSRVLVTMLEDPGHRYWVTDIEDGSFKINFNGTNSYKVPFNYLIDNANREVVNEQIAAENTASANNSTSTTAANAPQPGSANDPNAYTYDKENHKCFFNGEPIDCSSVPNFDKPHEGRFVNIPYETGGTPPAVDNPEGKYTWSKKTGLVPVQANQPR